MILPCKRQKCISYPSCVSKPEINCIHVRDLYDMIIKDNCELANRTAKAFAILHHTLPNLRTIKAKNDCV